MSACLEDEREAGKINHGLHDLFRQRMFAIACGYPDGNDAARRRSKASGQTEHLCGRGEIENRIKEPHHGLEIDRTSCTRFTANQLRVFLTAATYVLMQELRLHAARTGHARAQVSTLRERLLKLGAWIEISVRRIVLHLPKSFIDRGSWCCIARSLGAAPG